MKLSNWCVEISQTLDFWSPNSQLTIRYGRPFRNVFTIQTSTALMNWNSGWFRSGAILTRTLSTWLLDKCTRIPDAFVWTALISIASCELVHSCYNIWLFLHDWLAQIFRGFVVKIYKKYRYVLHKFCKVVQNAIKVTDFIPNIHRVS